MRFIYSKAFALFAGSLVVVAILLFLQVRGFLQPLEYVVLQAPRPIVYVAGHTIAPVRNFFTTLYGLGKINSQNIVLTNRVQDLEQQLVVLDQYKHENENLKKQLGFVSVAAFTVEPCTVIAIDPEGISDTMVINCGEDKNFKLGQAVVSEGYLVGKIIYVGKWTSTVILLTNARSESSVDAKVSRSGAEGLVKGSFGSGLVLDLIPQNTDLQKGDIVVSAGINSIIPPNIIVGEIDQVLSRPNDLFKKATVRTPIQFHQLQFVYVVK